MGIISLTFILPAIASIFIFYLLKSQYRIGYLGILSCAFIASYSSILLVYILLYSSVNYFLGLRIHSGKYKNALFSTGIVLNLLQLLVLRYSSFAIDPLLNILHYDFNVSKLSYFILPIGISYFTLQGIGYLVNIKMGWENPEKRFLNFLLYITFFPKFLSGPIERSNHFLPQLRAVQLFDEQQIAEGLRIAFFGFFKKIAIANQLAPFVLNTFSDINSINGDTLWIILIVGPLYLYFDFSGYTDIAIGLAKAYGIEILPNFNRPFFSENMTTFWKRFHISLSSWFNDYVFRQVSFKYRKWGVYASIFALMMTWTIFGIWHGAGWNFMILGIIQALVIIYEFFTRKWRSLLFAKVPGFLKLWIGRIITYLFFCGSLVFFYSPDIETVLSFFSNLAEVDGFTMINRLGHIPYSIFIYIPLLLLLELLDNDFPNTYSKLKNLWFQESTRMRLVRWSIYSVVIMLIFVVKNKAGQFIYVNF